MIKRIDSIGPNRRTHFHGSRLALALFPLGAACGGADPPPSLTAQDSGSMGAGSDAGAIGQIVADGVPCTEAHTICIDARMPDALEGAPTLLRITLYKSIPPTTPPDGVAGMFDAPPVSSGEGIRMKLSDGNLTGDYFVVGALYMPGGGTVIPVTGVDYASFSSRAYHLDGAVLDITEILTFQK
jgi:hypothetical protein